ncbi:unnamed protein product [Symbiodinium natans]|uniref:Uncharacterized protein n=1 Tax=Symbiodinium natans TaxID=878477 RepID=A0A812U2Q0_9DINO|nr:unnamed protein product [Symbiodinium natans]
MAATPWLTHLLLETCYDASELLLVGWSMGNHFACHACRQLEALGIPPRGICTLDDRSAKPSFEELDWECKAQTRPRVRISTAAMEFISPCRFVRKESGRDPVRLFGTDGEMSMKRALSFERSTKVWMSESDHHSVAVVNAWDISQLLEKRRHPGSGRSRRRRRLRRQWHLSTFCTSSVEACEVVLA